MKRLVVCLTALAMLVSGVGPARAEIILYTQGSPSGDTPGVFSNGPASGAFAASPPEIQEVENHFTLATRGTPTTLQWFGQPSSHPVGTPVLDGLRRAAAAIREYDEEQRCDEFLRQLDPDWNRRHD